MFAVLAAAEYASGGKNLAFQADWLHNGAAIAWSTPQMARPLLLLLIYHLFLLSTLLCAGLMEIDGHRLPVRLYLPALTVGVATAAIAALSPPGSLWRIWRHAVIGDAILDLPDAAPLVFAGVALAAVGVLWACDVIRRRAGLALQSEGPSWLLGFLAVEVCLGWQVAVVILAAAAVLDLPSLVVERRWSSLRIPASLLLLAATGAWILAGTNLVPA